LKEADKLQSGFTLASDVNLKSALETKQQRLKWRSTAVVEAKQLGAQLETICPCILVCTYGQQLGNLMVQTTSAASMIV
jgi:hypothetical protein